MTQVACQKCKSELVHIEQLTTYKSTGNGVGVHQKGWYIAENNDSSLQTKALESNFICETCGNKWKVDKKIFWEWTGD